MKRTLASTGVMFTL